MNFLSLSSNTLVRFSTCVFFLFLYEGKHTSLSFPIYDPENERTILLNSSLISCIFCSTIPTKLAAAGCSQTKSWFRIWSMVWMMFFLTSFNFRELYSTSDNSLPFLYSHEISLLLGIEINLCLLINSGFDAKGLEFQLVFFVWVLGVFPKIILFSAYFEKIGSRTGLTSSDTWLFAMNSFIVQIHLIDKIKEKMNSLNESEQETYNVFSNTIQVGMFHLCHTTTHSFNS